MSDIKNGRKNATEMQNIPSTIIDYWTTIISSCYHAKQGTNYLLVKKDQKWSKMRNIIPRQWTKLQVNNYQQLFL